MRWDSRQQGSSRAVVMYIRVRHTLAVSRTIMWVWAEELAFTWGLYLWLKNFESKQSDTAKVGIPEGVSIYPPHVDVSIFQYIKELYIIQFNKISMCQSYMHLPDFFGIDKFTKIFALKRWLRILQLSCNNPISLRGAVFICIRRNIAYLSIKKLINLAR